MFDKLLDLLLSFFHASLNYHRRVDWVELLSLRHLFPTPLANYFYVLVSERHLLFIEGQHFIWIWYLLDEEAELVSGLRP